MYPLNLPPAHILHLSSQLLWSGLFLLALQVANRNCAMPCWRI